MRVWLVAILSLTGHISEASETDIRAGAGVYRWTTESSSPFSLNIDGVIKLSSNKRHAIIPEFSLLIPETKYEVKREHYFLNLDYAYAFMPMLRVRTGPGFIIRRLQGTGGAETPDTYGDTLGSFGRPSKSQTGYAFTANLGLEGFTDKGFIRIESYFLQIFDAKRRSYSLAFTFGMNL